MTLIVCICVYYLRVSFSLVIQHISKRDSPPLATKPLIDKLSQKHMRLTYLLIQSVPRGNEKIKKVPRSID